jgi:hypothetical protein
MQLLITPLGALDLEEIGCGPQCLMNCALAYMA